ncbi:CLUMA_CG008263, isoform A [Clunio marinus]|uniref:CLUMA_CG008263, isoform A n=1 Tax=Clunio marinus TaxID=568069 RepID=A0A1J1I8M4_9DIPT|nr:CLUMA_CG008263, isoform A [Clunio marinus]
MERFAKIKTSERKRKLDVSGICRCCGMENEEKYPILGPFQEDDGVDFKDKFYKLTGIMVHKTDKMPQFICDMCMDKINDFYEFHLMAQNTEKQTREALGLPKLTVLNQVEPHVRLRDLKYSEEAKLLMERTIMKREIHNDHIPSTSKKRSEKLIALPQPPIKKSKKDISCSICSESFSYQSDFNDHLTKDHIPHIAKYGCGSCRETFDQLSDHKAHETWHTKGGNHYYCFRCLKKFSKLRDYNKHMSNSNCCKSEKFEVFIQDIKCFQCKKKFLTQNLFEWHGCLLKTKGCCRKCGQYFRQKKLLLKHYVLCEERFEVPDFCLDPALKQVKNERNAVTKKVVEVSNDNKKGPKKKTVPNRKDSTVPVIVKKELMMDSQQPPPMDDDYDNYDENITYDNYGNDSDSDEAPQSALEPHVELNENAPKIRIKQERLSDPPTVINQKNSSPLTAQIIRNIKKEKSQNPTVITTATSNIMKLKIKAERGGSAQLLNPLAVKQTPTARKKCFKIPQVLKMKIKMEKKDRGYGDIIDERDEAEAEDEDLLNNEPLPPVTRIKEEKLDPAYGDVHVKNKLKQLINPMALIRRDKAPVSNGFEKSLVISSVTSINPINSTSTDIQTDEIMQSMNSNVDNNARENFDDTNSKTMPEELHENDTNMVQIPTDLLKNQKNHLSQLTANYESLSSTEMLEATSNINNDEATTNDDLDALLKKYEDTPSADNNDLFQELLKFD